MPLPYNNWLAKQVVEASSAGRRTLLVSDRIEQLVDIFQRISATDCTVGFYVGQLNGKRVGEDQLEQAKKCSIILATYHKIGEGTNIPELDTLFLATPRADVEQVIGRIQRPCDDKKRLLIVDPVFQTGYNKRLADKRRKVYERLEFSPQKSE